MGWGYFDFRPYVPVAQRRRNAQREIEKLRKGGMDIQPVEIAGRKIARTFWGNAWCDHLESFSDFANRLPRGRTYVRNGSVCHLTIKEGKIEAIVSGSQLYNVEIRVEKLKQEKWRAIVGKCRGRVGSLLELLEGRISAEVMRVVTDRENGLFPLPDEILLGCDCPDWAVMCKHVAAVLYGVGARLDEQPALLFSLRGVDHEELILADTEESIEEATRGGKSKRVAQDELADVFGIDLDNGYEPSPPPSRSRRSNRQETTSRRKKATAKKQATGTSSAADSRSGTNRRRTKSANRKKTTAGNQQASPKPKRGPGSSTTASHGTIKKTASKAKSAKAQPKRQSTKTSKSTTGRKTAKNKTSSNSKTTRTTKTGKTAKKKTARNSTKTAKKKAVKKIAKKTSKTTGSSTPRATRSAKSGKAGRSSTTSKKAVKRGKRGK